MISTSRSPLSYKDRRSHQQQRFRFVGLILLVLALYELTAHTVAQPWVLENVGMQPDYPVGSRILVKPYLFRDSRGRLKHPPERGDVVCFQPPYVPEIPWYGRVVNSLVRLFTLQKLSIPFGGSQDWKNERVFKRVVGVPGDTVRLSASVAYVRGADEDFFISEFEKSRKSYDIEISELPAGWNPALPLSGNSPEVTLEEGEYFLLGDNRSASSDSRYWGVLPESAIRGRVLLTYWRPGGKNR